VYVDVRGRDDDHDRDDGDGDEFLPYNYCYIKLN
jgi:hypothetical protein